jgi:hypothetical protein
VSVAPDPTSERPSSTYRRRNDSPAWREIEQQQLALNPDCQRCGQPAVEAHRVGGCRTEGPYALGEAESLCRACHDEADPETAPGHRTAHDTRFDWWLR